MKEYKVAYITSHPVIQWPFFYRDLSNDPRINLKVFYCSLDNHLMKNGYALSNDGFEQSLLGGYDYELLQDSINLRKFFPNIKLFRYVNLGVYKHIKSKEYDAVVFPLWDNVTFLYSMILCKIFNVPYFLAGDSTTLTDQNLPWYKKHLKKIIFKGLIVKGASGFLYRGSISHQYYVKYGADLKKMFYYPPAVDVDRISEIRKRNKGAYDTLRNKYGMSASESVFLYVGRFSREKNIPELINSFCEIENQEAKLFLIGSGPDEQRIKDLVAKSSNSNIKLMGFMDKKNLYEIYSISDCLILSSTFEPYGAVVREAMCFGVPCIVSDKVGAAYDIVDHEENGYVYPSGDTQRLTLYMNDIIGRAQDFSSKSTQKMQNFKSSVSIDGLVKACQSLS